MRPAAGLLGLVLALTAVAEARAQTVLVPIPVDGAAFGGSRGLGFSYHRRSVSVSGYLSSGWGGSYGPSYVIVSPYGPPTSRVTINYYAPRPLVLAPVDDDVAGVDLDLIKPPRSLPPRQAPAPRPPEPQPELPGVDVSVPRKTVRPDEPEPEKKAKPEPPPPKPRPPAPAPPQEEPRDESGRLIQLGLEAFARQEYGLAARRFEQAAVADPAAPLSHFLQAQAQFALGKYRDAVASIHAGMRLRAGWPQAPFRPRLQLYKDREADLDTHLKRLETVLDKNPEQPVFLFLLGYELWFDGRRAEALPLFQRARGAAPDPTFIDEFLKAGAPVPVAAR
jgi:hypothetical protein